ncbi:MAG: PIG-L family deacetylase [Solirubrobacterales bacterium]
MLALHFAPHPDDELIGAPATLMALRDAGWRIVNVACGLGRPEQQARRQGELREACRLAGFELKLPPKPVSLSGDCDPVAARRELTELAVDCIGELEPRIVVSPGPGDRHHGHRLVAEAVRDAIAAKKAEAPRWWMWALWGALPQPTLGTRFDGARLDEILTALAAHRGELERNDYRRLVRARAEMTASLAAELLFGFGATAPAGIEYAELLGEVARVDDRWLLGRPRWLDPAEPLCDPSEIGASARGSRE